MDTVSFYFFFSSRRRHTRSDRDWSSDVCSSDLQALPRRAERGGAVRGRDGDGEVALVLVEVLLGVEDLLGGGGWVAVGRSEEGRVGEEGRSWGAPDHLKKKKRTVSEL